MGSEENNIYMNIAETCLLDERLRVGLIFKKDFIYLFTRDTKRGRDIRRGRSRLPVGSPMWDSILGS